MLSSVLLVALVPIAAGRGVCADGRRGSCGLPGRAAIGICNLAVRLARVGGGVAIVIGNQGVQFPQAGGGSAIWICAHGVQLAR